MLQCLLEAGLILGLPAETDSEIATIFPQSRNNLPHFHYNFKHLYKNQIPRIQKPLYGQSSLTITAHPRYPGW